MGKFFEILNLIQEQHYYPFGLAINEGQSATILPNKYENQGKELLHDLHLDWYDFTARQYDPQIGRFWGVDPASQFPSGYTGMGNDPSNKIDPSGCIAKVIPSSGPNNIGGGSGGGVSDGSNGDFAGLIPDVVLDNDAIFTQSLIASLTQLQSSVMQEISGGGGGGSSADQNADCGGTDAPVTPDNPTGQSTTQISSNSAAPDGTNIVSAVITGIGNSLKNLDNALDRGDFLDQIFGSGSSVGQSWNSFNNNHMLSDNKDNGLYGDWSGQQGWNNWGSKAVATTFGFWTTAFSGIGLVGDIAEFGAAPTVLNTFNVGASAVGTATSAYGLAGQFTPLPYSSQISFYGNLPGIAVGFAYHPISLPPINSWDIGSSLYIGFMTKH